MAPSNPQPNKNPTRRVSTRTKRKSIPEDLRPIIKIRPKHYLERIPIAGLHNFLFANRKEEKYFWGIVLLVAVGLTLFYLVPTIIEFARFQTVVESKRVLDPNLPFPHLYICVSNGVNGSYFREQFTKVQPQLLNDSRLQMLARRLQVDLKQLIRLTSAYVTYPPSADMSWVDHRLVFAFHEIIYKSVQAFGPNWTGIDGYYANAMLKCHSILKKCQVDGVEFPCCPKNGRGASASTTICFSMNVSGVIANENRGRTRPAKLTIKTQIDNQFSSPLSVESPNLLVIFGNHLPTAFDVTSYIPVGTTTYINVKSRRRQLSHGCMDRYRYDSRKHGGSHPLLQEYFKNMTNPQDYSVEKCTFAQMIEALSVRCGCVAHYHTLKPNDTTICTPAHLYACYYGAYQSSVQVSTSDGKSKDIFVHLKEAAAECMPLCDTWHYDAHTTFTALGPESSNASKVMHNEVIMTLDPEFSLDMDVLKIDRMTFFGDIGVGLSCLLGMSSITFIQAVVWVGAAVLLQRRLRRQVVPLAA